MTRLLTVLMFILSPVLFAAPIVKEHYEFYDIHPDSVSDIARELDRYTPIRVNGKAYRGHVNWQLSWEFDWQSKSNMCEIISVNIQLDVSYIMPRIPEYYRVGQRVRTVFKNYYAALLQHEKGHQKFGFLAAKELESGLLRVGSLYDCHSLPAELNTKAQAVVRHYIKRDREYDLKTQHGLLQGVVLRRFM